MIVAVLTVGTGQAYTTIAAAVAASASGDTVNVMAGTYTNDFFNISHNLTVQGVGGAVNLVATAQPPNGKAIIDEGGAGVSVTLSGLSFSGVTVPDGNGAGVRYEAGTLTLNNDTFTGNQEGILGAPDPNGVITINNSTFDRNGSGTGYTHNIYIGAIASLTVQNSTIKNAVVGHDIKSRAASNTITGNTITDTSGSASYEIDLPNGGVASISGNVIEKGPTPQNPFAITYGEEGEAYAANSLSITNNLIVNDYPGNTTAIRNNLSDVTATVSGNTFYGWRTLLSGSAALLNNTLATTEPALVPPGLLPPISPITNPLFDVVYYLLHNPDVAAAGVDPLQHYMTTGWKEGRDPSALFSTSYYEANNPDVKAAGVNPLQHFETNGWTEGRNPSAAFDTNDYLAANPDVKAAGIDPLQHYINNGKAEGRAAFAVPAGGYVTDPLVDAAYVYAERPDVAKAGADASQWFDLEGWKEGADPSAAFSTRDYLAANPDVKAAGINPLLHYINNGKAEGRAAFAVPAGGYVTDPLVNAAFLYAQRPDVAKAGADAGQWFLAEGWKENAKPDALFDTAYYLAQNPDVAAAHVDPLLHYETVGWKEGRNPSAQFSTNKYEAAYADVKAAGVDPLLHYITNGQAEGRQAFSV